MSDHKELLVLICRHGQTTLNAHDMYRGPMNPPLDKTGLRQANELAFWLEPVEISSIVSSDKVRAKQTADIINQRKHLPVRFTDIMRPLDVGNLGGKRKTPETEKLVQYHVDHPDIPFEGGGSLNEFRSRVRPVIAGAIGHALNEGKPVLLIGHSSIIHEIGEMIEGHHQSVLVEPGGCAAIYLDGDKLRAEPIFKPDQRRIMKRGDAIT